MMMLLGYWVMRVPLKMLSEGDSVHDNVTLKGRWCCFVTDFKEKFSIMVQTFLI